MSSLGKVNATVLVQAEGVGLGAASIDPITAEVSVVAIPWGLLVLIVAALPAFITPAPEIRRSA